MAKAAEEIERLRTALQRVVDDYDDSYDYSDDKGHYWKIEHETVEACRKALEGK